MALIAGIVTITSCEDPEDPTPTNELMEGVWEMNSLYDNTTSGEKKDSVVAFFPQWIHMDDMNSVNSTLGPLFMWIVYGDSKFISVTSKIDEVFKYADLQLTEGEWFIDKNKVVDNFTIEIKMKFPTMETVTEIFDIFNIDLPEFAEDAMDLVIYHKFKYVGVTINDDNPDKMVWTFGEGVQPTYNTKDQYGDPVLYHGLDVNPFSECTITFERKAKSLTDLIQEHTAPAK
ncbi:MAG: hypothetical protein A2W91_19100 [Bacteroidetes bacterium GWF2_38_335]|nr:MAG: hypothetical protein A2W91_19100 [Bacteroidetes bacterium GWF2_38_335]HBS86322.1 hypothetical protein [Bacteroidales bacterium]